MNKNEQDRLLAIFWAYYYYLPKNKLVKGLIICIHIPPAAAVGCPTLTWVVTFRKQLRPNNKILSI